MECREVKNNLSAFLDRELDPQFFKEIEAHLASCPGCLQESQQMARAWGLLDLAPTIEPSADFVSRFWTKVATQESAYERFLRGFKALWGNRRLVPVVTALSLMIIIGSTGVVEQINMQNKLSQMKTDDIEMLKNIDLAEHFETIKDLDIIKDLDSAQKESVT
ncbi:MAG: zf-HC2 domain-containing protein [Candidatus Omnitrophica bacterium]|nr:zf-HC2 domain-containing protein [Candidatus Omnitrophota bacterium]